LFILKIQPRLTNILCGRQAPACKFRPGDIYDNYPSTECVVQVGIALELRILQLWCRA